MCPDEDRAQAISALNERDGAIGLLCLRAALSAAVCNELAVSEPDDWPGNRMAWQALYHYEEWCEARQLKSWRDLSPEEASQDVIRGMVIPRVVLIDGTVYRFPEADAIIERIARADEIVHGFGFMRCADHGSELRDDVARLAPLVRRWIELKGQPGL